MRFRHCIPAIACTLVLVSACYGQKWQTVARGVKLANLTYQTPGNRTVKATALLCNPHQVKLRTIDVYQALGSASASSGYNLDEVFSKVKPIAAINAGPTSSFTLPAPVGLLVVGGRVRSKLNLKAAKDSGVFCTSDSGRARLAWAYNFSYYDCPYGVQAAPVLFIGDLPSTPQSTTAEPRTVVGLTTDDELIFLQVGPINFIDLKEQLKEHTPISIAAAMCLDGSTSSGLIARVGGQLQRSGSTGTLIASAIVVEGQR